METLGGGCQGLNGPPSFPLVLLPIGINRNGQESPTIPILGISKTKRQSCLRGDALPRKTKKHRGFRPNFLKINRLKMKTSALNNANVIGRLAAFALLCILALAARPATAQPANDDCSGAIPIAYGSTVSGTTVGAHHEDVNTECEVDIKTWKSVWYRITGDGGSSFLGLIGDHISYITVYEGTCNVATCFDRDGGSREVYLLFPTTIGQSYLVEIEMILDGNFSLYYGHQIPANNTCVNALPISNGMVMESLAYSSPDSAPDCVVPNSAGGIWYSFVGNGSTAMATLYTHKPRLTIYKGTCSGLICVSGSEDTGSGYSEIQETFVTEPGTTYFVFVHYVQTIWSVLKLTFNQSPPPNDLSSNAIPLGCGETLTGATIAALTTQPNPPTCGGIPANTRDVWYKFNGNGQNMTISTCSGPNLNTQVSIYIPTPAGLQCVAGNDNFCGLRSQVTVATSAYVPYLVRVAGASNAQGIFNITRTCSAPANNDCENATLLATNQLTGGSNEAATVQTPFPPNCATTDGTASDVWYRFVGNGTNATVSLCGTTASFDAQLSVFTGACGSLSCVAANDNFCSNRPQVTFATTYGTIYRVRVNGKNNAQGGFGITLTFFPPANDACANATLVTCGSDTDGTTAGATAETTSDCGVPLTTSPGVWYRFVGNGGIASVNTCDLFNNNFDTKIRVFTGTCTGLACVAGNDNAGGHCGNSSSTSFQTTAGTTYRILVNGALNQSGNFTLSVNCGAPLTGGGGTEGFFAGGDETPEQLPGAPFTFSLFPNPASNGEVSLAMPPLPEAKEVALEIRNLLGQPVLRHSFGRVDAVEERISLSGLASGLYVATLRAGNERATVRLVIGSDW
jgi:Secretion system C-terminal sorting domain